jgi:phosphoglycolate phosphatase-like HAD superfamily hydrolase
LLLELFFRDACKRKCITKYPPCCLCLFISSSIKDLIMSPTAFAAISSSQKLSSSSSSVFCSRHLLRRRGKTSLESSSSSKSSSVDKKKQMDVSASSNKTSTLFALDFDGVVCDSVGESSLSAWKHGVQLWPELFEHERANEKKDTVLDKLRAVRPVVETGYENTILARALLENLNGYDVESILKDWPILSEKLMQKWQLDRKTMVLEFGKIRDDWIRTDFKSWLQPNALYEDVPEALRFCTERRDAKVTIVTTKQARFADAILVDMGGVKIPEEDLISTTVSGEPKADVLVRLEETFNKDGASRMIFVEDKLSTLIKVANDKRLSKWDLFFVDWGYNTEDERQVAKHDYRMKLIGKEEFCGLLREG